MLTGITRVFVFLRSVLFVQKVKGRASKYQSYVRGVLVLVVEFRAHVLRVYPRVEVQSNAALDCLEIAAIARTANKAAITEEAPNLRSAARVQTPVLVPLVPRIAGCCGQGTTKPVAALRRNLRTARA